MVMVMVVLIVMMSSRNGCRRRVIGIRSCWLQQQELEDALLALVLSSVCLSGDNFITNDILQKTALMTWQGQACSTMGHCCLVLLWRPSRYLSTYFEM